MLVICEKKRLPKVGHCIVLGIKLDFHTVGHKYELFNVLINLSARELCPVQCQNVYACSWCMLPTSPIGLSPRLSIYYVI